MPTNLTYEFLEAFFNGSAKGGFYQEATKKYEDLRLHFNGEKPGELVTERRPNESEGVQKYREKIYEPTTKEDCGKVYTELGKIRKAEGYGINWQQAKNPSQIAEAETPEMYFSKEFPDYKSVSKWGFSVLLKEYLVDANAVVAMIPIAFEFEGNKYMKPFPYIFHADRVLDFQTNDYCILLSSEVHYYNDGETDREGEVFYVITTTHIQRWVETSLGKEYTLNREYEHKLGYLPARKVKGIFNRSKNANVLWDSRVNYMLPHLNEAVREYSDLQAAVVQHNFPEKWVVAGTKCKRCKGIGQVGVTSKEGQPTNCPECGGIGRVSSPFEHIVVQAPEKVGPNSGEAIIPPAGYVEKDIGILKLQDERIEKHKYKALSSINMQFLHRVPLSESGISKEVDRDSLNTFVNSVAEDIVDVMDWVILVGVDLRYGKIVPSSKARLEMLPQINIPQSLNLLTEAMMMEDIKKAKDSGMSPGIVSELELQYANKKFAHDPQKLAMLKAKTDLDPLHGMTEDDKLVRRGNRVITLKDFVTSTYIDSFVKRAVRENESFFEEPYDKQVTIISVYAEEKMKELDAASAIDTDEE